MFGSDEGHRLVSPSLNAHILERKPDSLLIHLGRSNPELESDESVASIQIEQVGLCRCPFWSGENFFLNVRLRCWRTIRSTVEILINNRFSVGDALEVLLGSNQAVPRLTVEGFLIAQGLT